MFEVRPVVKVRKDPTRSILMVAISLAGGMVEEKEAMDWMIACPTHATAQDKP